MYSAIDTAEKLDFKLKKANEIMADITVTEKNITPVLPSDRQLFEEFFAKEKKHTYGNSWVYVTQGVRGIGPYNLGYKYYDGENLCMLCAYPKVEDPGIIMLYWIRPTGPKIISIITDYSRRILNERGISSYVKKLFLDQRDNLFNNGFNSSKDFPWHSGCHSEDDTFPELIFDRERTLIGFEKNKKLRYLTRVTTELVNQHGLHVSSENFDDLALVILKEYFTKEYVSRASEKLNISTMFDYYNMVFNCCDDKNVERAIVFTNKNPVGFYVYEQNLLYTNLYALITLKNKCPHLSDYAMINIFNNSKSKFINAGGSEDEGMHGFKEKFDPVRFNQMFWATNYPLYLSKNCHTSS